LLLFSEIITTAGSTTMQSYAGAPDSLIYLSYLRLIVM